MAGDTTDTPIRTTVTLSVPNRGRRQAPAPPTFDQDVARSRLRHAEAALLDDRRLLTTEELTGLAELPDQWVTSLAALAHQVRLTWCGPEVEVEGILSAKTGGCPEDCHFCSQSSRFDTPVKATPFLDADEVLRAAEETRAAGASEFCIVLAVRGPDERTVQRILELVPMVRDRTGLNVAVERGPAHRGAGPSVRRGWRPPLQPQPRDGPVILPQRGDHAHVGGASGDLPPGPAARHGALLRRADRHG